MDLNAIRIDENRLIGSLRELAEIGALPGGGVQRLAFTEEDRAGRDYVAGRLEAIGLQPRIDEIGNLFAIRPGADPEAGMVLLGSHTDTVGSAGIYDGALGVLAALEVLTVLQGKGIETVHPTGLVSFVNEEGVRFMPDMMGSLYVRGDLGAAPVRKIVGTDGTSIGNELDRLGMAGEEQLPVQGIRAFLEVHIEQGPELERLGRPAGAVTGVQGLRWLDVQLAGQANHAGTTPMADRADCGAAAGRIITGIRRLTQETDGLRGTVGRIRFEPNLINVIPGKASLTVDLRHPDQTRLESSVAQAVARIQEAAAAEGLDVGITETASAPAVTFDREVVAAIVDTMDVLGIDEHRMISGAGHDAQILASACPAGMIFVRSKDGISHNPAEFSSDDDCIVGTRLLLGATLQLARAQEPSSSP